ncbi:hypothetical protein [Streptomyces sp. SID5910]|uniref:hypothetical protein n=1 Tax=Streptomyces sp. SID5910 TaxID=2690312 RepID=UPI001368C9A5|nr:hypothetical protein [Streptomyces sp. SID5910]MYR45922.1 hypothetical protein [Streptomyces sp. SID5910]
MIAHGVVPVAVSWGVGDLWDPVGQGFVGGVETALAQVGDAGFAGGEDGGEAGSGRLLVVAVPGPFRPVVLGSACSGDVPDAFVEGALRLVEGDQGGGELVQCPRAAWVVTCWSWWWVTAVRFR